MLTLTSWMMHYWFSFCWVSGWRTQVCKGFQGLNYDQENSVVISGSLIEWKISSCWDVNTFRSHIPSIGFILFFYCTSFPFSSRMISLMPMEEKKMLVFLLRIFLLISPKSIIWYRSSFHLMILKCRNIIKSLLGHIFCLFVRSTSDFVCTLMMYPRW